jgi:hypothetical protein
LSSIPVIWTARMASKSWKPLIHSLKDCRKPPSQDFRAGFSTGPHIYSYTLPLSQNQVCPLWALISPKHLPSCSNSPQPCAWDPHSQLLSHIPLLSAHHTLTTSPPFFLVQHKSNPF